MAIIFNKNTGHWCNMEKEIPSKKIVDDFISSYVRFLKEHNIDYIIKKYYIINKNKKTFINKLHTLSPHQYFSSFDKGWYWDDLRFSSYKFSRSKLESINDRWLVIVKRKSYDKYDWGKYREINKF